MALKASMGWIPIALLFLPTRIHMHHAVLDRGEGSLDLLVDAFGDRVGFREGLVRIGGDLHVDVAS